MNSTAGSLRIWLLALLCATLGYGVYDQSRKQSIRMPVPISVSEKQDDAPVSDLSLGFKPLTDIADLNQMIDRPLFAQTRRPDPPGTEQPTAQPEPKKLPFNFELTGVMILNEQRVALLKQIKGRKVLQGTVGQTIEGWEIQLIEPNHVVMQRSGETRTLKLEDRPQIAPRRPAKVRKLKKQSISPSVQPRRQIIDRSRAPTRQEPENKSSPERLPPGVKPPEG